MKEFFFFEWKKLLAQRKLLFFVGVLFLGQFSLFYISGGSGSSGEKIPYSGYVSLVKNVREGRITLEEIKERVRDSEGLTVEYTDNVESETKLYQIVEEEMLQIKQYPKFIQGILHKETAFVVSDDVFDSRNEDKAKHDYSAFQNMTLTFCGSYGISLLSGCNIQDLLVILIFVLIVVGLVAEEREKRTDILLHIAPRGRREIGAVKFIMGMCLTAFLTGLIYIGRILLIAVTYGTDSWNAPIQSVVGFSSCIWDMSIMEYLGLYLLFKILAGMMLYSLCFLCVSMFLSVWKALVSNVVGIAIFYLLYCNIKTTSWLAFLKWYNPIAFFDSGRVISDYHNCNFFAYPIHYSTVCMVISLIVILGLGIWNICLFDRKPMQESLEDSLWAGHHSGRGWKMRLFSGELYKCFVCEKGIGLYCFLVVFMFLFIPTVKDELIDLDTVYYRNYVKGVEGEYSEEKLNTLYAEKQRIEENEKQLGRGGLTMEATQVLSKTVQRKNGLERVIQYGEYLKEKKDVNFIYDTGYMIWLGIKKNDTLFYLHILSVLMMVVLSVSVWRIEDNTGMKQLIQISAIGNERMCQIKRRILLICALLIWITVFGFFTYQIGKEFGYAGLMAGAQSITFFSSVPSQIKIWEVILLVYLVKLLYLFLVGCFVCYIAKWVKGYLLTTVVSCVVFLIPVLLLYL